MNLKAVCFGEILYDIFPNEERIGGAPLNVASRLSGLGIKTEMISKVGDDEKGEKLISYLKSKNIKTENISKDTEYCTGVVNVTLSESGSATYDIAHPAAWDKIRISEGIKNSVKEADAFIFGSLVCRDKVSREALFKLLPEAKYRVFDINLRPPYYEKETLVKLMEQANFIKFNDDELFEIAEMLGSPYNSLEQNLQFLSEKTNTKDICVTKGRHGAVLLKNGTRYYNSGFKMKVKDTVGAGDSFLASLIAGLLKEEDLQRTLDFACAVGALVAGEEGANPILSKKRIYEFSRIPEKE
ncbi:carbohydrate kinase family protein [Autumnicola psychrophila]|uniref:Carbohydrate kinase n=1 Tax=Autumnicola psychrophila TaxID=3075592 RepID=A0ABU3DVC7_9FLAO|nr:carbohydrate kinase [Zunongwangia sp. F225]MDT0687680.1 carbohydrate kinase [Zunongwangia sp. F225]